MKKQIVLCSAAVLALLLTNKTDAATQIYDLKADWSYTQNPNGPWSYRDGESLLTSNPLPWVGAGYPDLAILPPLIPAMERVAGTLQAYDTVIYFGPGSLEDGDVVVVPGGGDLDADVDGNILWRAPVNGTIDISGSTWAVLDSFALFPCAFDESFVRTSWMLTHNGSPLTGGNVGLPLCGSSYEGNPRGLPYDFSSGSGGAGALQNIPVAAGDQIVLAFTGWPVGVTLTIELTPDSVAVDPAAAIQQLAETVAAMNLHNGIDNSLDSKLDAALNALDDVNTNNDVAACNSLAAFINAVAAQAGSKITDAQAIELISAAQEIQGILNCGN